MELLTTKMGVCRRADCVGCVLSIFDYWLENRRKKTRSRR
ncbi:type I toxin-antitoxin system Fst family toxin [Listeria booriae]